MLTENLIKGQLVELKVQEELTRYGFDISVPTYNASRYDLIVDTGIELLKIQVKKSIGLPNGRFQFSCTSQNVRTSGSKHKYTIDEVDYFATVWKDRVYLIPIDETSVTKTLAEDNSDEYLAKNVLQAYSRLDDDSLYNYRVSGEKHYCVDCGAEIQRESTRCIQCNNALRRMTERPSRDELKSLLRNHTFLYIGNLYNVTDNAVRKWCDALNLPRKSSVIKKYTEEEWQLL
jgi:hypothetical protein